MGGTAPPKGHVTEGVGSSGLSGVGGRGALLFNEGQKGYVPKVFTKLFLLGVSVGGWVPPMGELFLVDDQW